MRNWTAVLAAVVIGVALVLSSAAHARSPAAVEGRAFATVDDLLTSPMQDGDLAPGTLVHAGLHRYVVRAGASALTTAGGLGLDVVPVAGRVDVTAFADRGNTADFMFARALARPGNYLIPPGEYPITQALILHPGTHLHVSAGVHLRLVDGAVDNLIRNANATAPLEPMVALDTSLTYATHPAGTEVRVGNHRFEVVEPNTVVTDLVTAQGVQLIPALDRNISISGDGALAVLDGNGTRTRTVSQVERWRWIGLLFENVDGLEVSRLLVRDSTRWGISCQAGCYNARFQDLHFFQPGYRGGDGIPNQDCINLRSGVREVYVGRIYGQCGDDAVALTTIHPDWTPGSDPVSRKPAQINMNVAYRPRDIGYVTIEQIQTDAIGSHHKVRLLGSDLNAVHHIHISDIHDHTVGPEVVGNEYGRFSATAAILIGSARYGRAPHADETLMHNIHISNVSTLTRSVVRFQWSSSDVYMTGLSTQWSARTDSETQSGQQAYLVFYDYEDAFPPPPGTRAVHRRHVLDGAAMLHDGQDVARPWDLRDGGSAVSFDKDLTVTESSYSDVFIKAARHAVSVGPRVELRNVHFEDFRINRLGQMAFRVRGEDVQKRLDWSADDFTLLDRDRLWAGHRNQGEFYSRDNTMRLGPGMPEVLPGETIPVPVDRSQVRFRAGAGGFEQETDAHAMDGQWVSQ